MTELKLCGNHSISDLKNTINSQATYIGIIFAESKRKVDPKQLAEWLKIIKKPKHKQLVAVFVNPSINEIENVLEYVPIDILQLHGHESLELVLRIKHYFGLPIFKAIHHHPPESYLKMEELMGVVEGFIIDSKVRGAWGGTGVIFDWEAIPNYVTLSKKFNKKCFIAGGITPENVEKCLVYGPPGIDLSSGIEKSGKKDRQLIRRLEERIIDYEQNISR